MKTIMMIGTFFLLYEAKAQRPLELPGGESQAHDPLKKELTLQQKEQLVLWEAGGEDTAHDPLKKKVLAIDETIQKGGEDTVFDPMKNRSLAIGQIMQAGGEDTVFDPLKNKTTALDEIMQEGGESTAYDEMKKEEQANKRPVTQSGGEDTAYDPLKDERDMNTLTRKNRITEEDITIYPNPATDLLVIQSNGSHPDGIELYDMSGRMVQQIDGSTVANEAYRLQVGHLQRGWYNLVLRYDAIVITKKTVLL